MNHNLVIFISASQERNLCTSSWNEFRMSCKQCPARTLLTSLKMCSKDANVGVPILTRLMIVPSLTSFGLHIHSSVLFLYSSFATDKFNTFTASFSGLPHRLDVTYMYFFITKLKLSNEDSSKKLWASNRKSSSRIRSKHLEYELEQIEIFINIRKESSPTTSSIEYIHV